MSPLTKYTVRHLFSRPFISLLLLGISAITGAAIGGMITLGTNLERALIKTASPTHLIVLSKGATTENDSGLADNVLGQLVLVDGAKASGEIYNSIALTFGTRVENVAARGLDQEGYDLRHAKIVSGRAPTKGEREVAVGMNLARRHEDLAIGKEVRLGNKPFKVVGTFETGTAADGEIWTPRGVLGAVYGSPEMVGVVHIELPSAARVDEQSANVGKLTLKPPAEAWTEAKLNSVAFEQYKPLYRVLTIVGLLILFGAVLSVTIALSLIFATRTGEFTSLRALGFGSGTVVRLILVESNLLALAGALLGIGLAFLVFHHRSIYAGETLFIELTITPTIVATVIGAIVAACTLGALIPVRRALTLHVAEGLREE